MEKYVEEPNNGTQNDVSGKEENQFLIENVRKSCYLKHTNCYKLLLKYVFLVHILTFKKIYFKTSPNMFTKIKIKNL